MYFSPGEKVASHAKAGMPSVLEGAGNNNENKQGLVYEAQGTSRRRGPVSPEKYSLSHHPGLGVSLLEGDAFSLGCSRGGEWGEGKRRRRALHLGHFSAHCGSKGINIQGGMRWWGDRQACSVRHNE